MKQLWMSLLAWSFVLVAPAMAQTQPTAPADPLQPAETVVMPAQVRIVNLSPNADSVNLELRREGEDGEVVTLEGVSELAYNDTTEYQQLDAGQYHLTVTADGSPAATETITVEADSYHTIAVLGLVLPEEGAETEEESGGFFEWLSGLFTGENAAGRDALELRVLNVRDELFAELEGNQRRVRVVHAAPGTAPIDLAVVGETGQIIGDVEFGEASGYENLDETVGDLEIRIAGSRATLLDLSEEGLEPGRITTVFVTGTPVEEVPIETVVLSDMPQRLPEAQPAPAPGEPVAPEPVDPEAPASEQEQQEEPAGEGAEQGEDTEQPEQEPGEESGGGGGG